MSDEITGRHEGATVYVIGKGTSIYAYFKHGKFERLRGKIVIAVNSIIWRIPHARYWIFFDNHRIGPHRELFEKCESELIFHPSMNRGELPDDPRLVCYKVLAVTIPARKWGEPLYFGNSSAVLATNLAVIMGAARIELLGIDLGDAGTGVPNCFAEEDGGIDANRAWLISSSFRFVSGFLREWGIEVITRCRFEHGVAQTNLRDWDRCPAPLLFPALPLEEL